MRLLAAFCIGLFASTVPMSAHQQSTPQASPQVTRQGEAKGSPQQPPRDTAQSKADGTLPPVVSDTFAAQVLLDRVGFSTGEIDGEMGANVKRALTAFQKVQGLPPSGELDQPTWQKLQEVSGNVSPLTSYTVTDADLAGPFTASIPDDIMEQAKLKALDYRDPIEAIAERFHIAPALLRKLNPGAPVDKAGAQIMVANVTPFEWSAAKNEEDSPNRGRGARGATATTRPNGRGTETTPPAPQVTVYVTKSTSALTVEENGRVIFHAPVTSGSVHDPLPIGQWKVTTIQRSPVFHYNPDLFWDARPGHSKAEIPAGPNNPVGIMWIDLSKEHYGIHGTPEPSQVGHVQSHGCVRLTNWDVARVSQWLRPGASVIFRE
jgi:lipoprotein-anchoring transpeptidase ErfK/SrfK